MLLPAWWGMLLLTTYCQIHGYTCCSCRWVRLRLWTAATDGPIVHPQMIYEYGEPWWNYIDRENRRTRRITCPSATLSTTTPTYIDLGAHAGLRGEKPTEPWHGLRLLFKMTIMSVGWDYLSELRPPTGMLFVPRWYMSMENHGEMLCTGANSSCIHQSSLAIVPAVI
jgi:hypothetical protein